MPKKRNVRQDIRDIVEQGIISTKSLTQFLKAITKDKRTITTTQKASAEFFEGKTKKQAGEELGISYQRAAVLERQISAGKVYSPELRDILKEKSSTPFQSELGFWVFPNEQVLRKLVGHFDLIKTFPFLEDAENWLREVINSDQYFAILKSYDPRSKTFAYKVIGLGNREQRPRRKGKRPSDRSGENRARQIIAKWKKSV